MMGSVRTYAAAARVQASAGGGAMPAGGKAVLTNKALRVFRSIYPARMALRPVSRYICKGLSICNHL